jgi:hypothetical protein
MQKQCIFYYATVVSTDKDKWAEIGDHPIEPIRMEGEMPLGKNPDFCCAEMETTIKDRLIYYPAGGKEPHLQFASIGEKQIRFCPFCAAEVIFRENLKVRVTGINRIITSHRYEKVSSGGANAILHLSDSR